MIAHWDTFDDSLAFYHARGRGISEDTNGKCRVSHFRMQEEDILEHTNGKCQRSTF
jgi:hypothetical protein